MRVFRILTVLACAVAGAAIAACSRPAPEVPPAPVFDLEEATIASLQERMQKGQDTARSIAEKYLARIDAIDRHGPGLHSVIEINPDALAIADALDLERKTKGPRGPLHGIPVLIKDNIATARPHADDRRLARARRGRCRRSTRFSSRGCARPAR